MSEKKKILIVEDEAPMLKALVDKLSQSGFETLKANNGDDGLIIALKEHPDLILLDIVLPRVDGLTMMEKLRKDSWGENIPVIILTNLSLAEMEISKKSKILEKLKKIKPVQYLEKTELKLEDLVEKIKKILG